VNAKQYYGKALFQGEIFMNLKKIVQTVTHIFNCNPYVRLFIGEINEFKRESGNGPLFLCRVCYTISKAN